MKEPKLSEHVLKIRARGHDRAYAPWSKEDDQKLLSLSKEKSVAQLAKVFGRTSGAIGSRLGKLQGGAQAEMQSEKVMEPRSVYEFKPWSGEDDEKLMSSHKGMSWLDLARMLGRSINDVRLRIKTLEGKTKKDKSPQFTRTTKYHFNVNNPWTKSDEKKLLALFLTEKRGALAKSLGRNRREIRTKYAELVKDAQVAKPQARREIEYENTNIPTEPVKPVNIEFNEQSKLALKLMEDTRGHLFITGNAGTGKSTLLNHFRSITKKNVVVVAPTGIAALNIKGQTIHSFFKFNPSTTMRSVKKVKDVNKHLYNKLDTVVIDEVSMVRADLLDCVEAFLRLNGPKPGELFGGVQMIFIGDLYQLPPVLKTEEKGNFGSYYDSPFFFDANCLKKTSFRLLELRKIYRQKNPGFVSLLNAIRNNTVTAKELDELNKRVQPDFAPTTEDFYIYLSATNDVAEQINKTELEKLKSKLFSFTGYKNGDFDPNEYPTSVNLELKVGSQVMLLNNDVNGRWVNGSMGKILEFRETKNGQKSRMEVVVKLSNGQVENVGRFCWQKFKQAYDGGKIVYKEIGSYFQYPLRLAWAVTIHKSQGKTFDRVAVDVGRGTFAPGQMYVALSRCTSLEGIVLKKPVEPSHVFIDTRVVAFMNRLKANSNVEIFKKF